MNLNPNLYLFSDMNYKHYFKWPLLKRGEYKIYNGTLDLNHWRQRTLCFYLKNGVLIPRKCTLA